MKIQSNFLLYNFIYFGERMNKRILTALCSVSLLAGSMFFASCEDTTSTNTPTKVAPAAPTNLMALSISADTVRIKWTASTSESATNFQGYTITATEVGTTTTQTLDPVGKVTPAYYQVSGLKPGVAYRFDVRARNSDTTSTVASITWAGAVRKTGIVYESAASAGSGIQLSTGSNQTKNSATTWDLCLDSKDGNFFFGSPAASTYTDAQGKYAFTGGSPANGTRARMTMILAKSSDSLAYTITSGSLDSLYLSQSMFTTTPNTIRGETGAENLQSLTQSFVMFAQTADSNFVKILVKAVSGKVVQSSSPNRNVEIEYTYQGIKNQAFGMVQPRNANGSFAIKKAFTKASE
jgi:hypothetical protein